VRRLGRDEPPLRRSTRLLGRGRLGGGAGRRRLGRPRCRRGRGAPHRSRRDAARVFVYWATCARPGRACRGRSLATVRERQIGRRSAGSTCSSTGTSFAGVLRRDRHVVLDLVRREGVHLGHDLSAAMSRARSFCLPSASSNAFACPQKACARAASPLTVEDRARRTREERKRRMGAKVADPSGGHGSRLECLRLRMRQYARWRCCAPAIGSAAAFRRETGRPDDGAQHSTVSKNRSRLSHRCNAANIKAKRSSSRGVQHAGHRRRVCRIVTTPAQDRQDAPPDTHPRR